MTRMPAVPFSHIFTFPVQTSSLYFVASYAQESSISYYCWTSFRILRNSIVCALAKPFRSCCIFSIHVCRVLRYIVFRVSTFQFIIRVYSPSFHPYFVSTPLHIYHTSSWSSLPVVFHTVCVVGTCTIYNPPYTPSSRLTLRCSNPASNVFFARICHFH